MLTGYTVDRMNLMDQNHRLVHLDLKGAPPRVEYLEQVIPLFKKLGATGLLIEYEDMFPYYGELEEVASQHAYSKEAIYRIQQLAEENSLIIIPLVQSFGHFEFVLKHEKFRSLREVPNYPMALCPSNPDSLMAVCMMIDQVMELHQGLRWFHIGADEVYHIGICDKCKKRMHVQNLTQQQLFFSHCKAVLNYIKVKYPSVTAIMWDDMLRHTELSVLLESGLAGLVEPMIWHYLTKFLLPPDIWDKFSKLFPNIWLGSAFKGATGSNMYLTNIGYHIENHLVWVALQEKEKQKFQTIRGYAVTGWSRYDHYAVLCELLPQALPSLGICLSVLNKGTFNADLHNGVSDVLKFKSHLPISPFQCLGAPPCDFPGHKVYRDMLDFNHLEASYEDLMHNESIFTWMNEYQIKRNFVNPVHVGPLLNAVAKLLESFRILKARLQSSLSEVFYDTATEEWMNVYFFPKKHKLKDIIENARNSGLSSLIE
ncbi:hexosaminidase D-like isoform X2 [Mytilus trossulus]|uniref:hexosaminidase D-like isoform X2 n=1 Tax=Mytilus trossulus TaxID=6551 RepID=UPI003004D62F